MLNWDDLRVFLALRRAGSFAAAGRQLGVNATTAARRLTALEQAVGAQLFTRTRDGLVPTAEGEAILEPAELVERQAQRIERSVGAADARLAGRVRVNSTENMVAYFLLDHLSVFRRRNPDIEIEIDTTDAIVDLSRGQAEIVIRLRPPDAGPGVESTGHVEVIAKRVASLGVAVFASKAYLERAGFPADIADVSGHDLIMPRAGYLPGSAWSASVEAQARTKLLCDGLVAMQSACSAGFGLSALPCFAALRYENLMRVSDTVATRHAWILMPADLKRVARVRAMWSYLVDLFEQWQPLLSGEVTPADRDARPSAGSR